MLFCYPADSGQDYDIIARSGGMRARIVDDGGGWKQVENPNGGRAMRLDAVYRPQPAGIGA